MLVGTSTSWSMLMTVTVTINSLTTMLKLTHLVMLVGHMPLTGEHRDKVISALARRKNDRDDILGTVEANGYDITGL